MTKYFLAKSEPAVYSIADLARDRQTVWDGVKNPQALQAIRAMKPGDHVLIYHSGGESQVVGAAKVISPPRPDPNLQKSYVVHLAFLAYIDPPVTLKEIKQSGLFDGWSLVRQSRLSTMAAPQEFIDWLKARRPGLKF